VTSPTIPAPGPLAWRNWKAFDVGAPLNGAFEYELYTDAYVDGGLTTGPCQWIDTYASSHRPITGVAVPALTLRIAVHLTDAEFVAVDFDKPNTKDYLAGDMGDEISSLASLALNRRIRSSGLTRRFERLDGPGIPYQPFHRVPRLGAPSPGRPSVLPGVSDRVDPGDAAGLLEKYPRTSINNARALARAARLFADALWIADDDPAQAWLRLVSAVESAAAQWKSEGASPLDRLRKADPALAELVEQAGDAAGPLAERLAVTAKATAKFVDFLAAHLPDLPSRRPAYGFVDWDDLGPALLTVYDHRSRDLHAGTPFPGPLCEPPGTDSDGVPTERVHSLGVAGQGGVWSEGDLPLHLHTFAYIAGGALRNWWASIG
jgi:hypothetical protein